MAPKLCNHCGRRLRPYGGIDWRGHYAWGRGPKVQRVSAAFRWSFVYCCRRNINAENGNALRNLMWNEEIISIMSEHLFGTDGGQRRAIQECATHKLLAVHLRPFSTLHEDSREIVTSILKFVF